MACGCTDKLTTLLSQHRCNGLAVFAAQGLTGQDHGASVNFVGVQTRGLVGLVDDFAQRGSIDGCFAEVGRQGYRRLVNRCALNDGIPARQVFGDSSQM